MKKVATMVLALSMLLNICAAFGEGMEVQPIPGPDPVTETVTLDDFKLNHEVTIEGYGRITGTYFGFIDKLGYYQQGDDDPWHNKAYESGNDAEYAFLKVDIVNTATRTKNFLEQCEVKAVYDDIYEFSGWSYQFNHNNRHKDNQTQNTDDVIDKADVFGIDPMYAGHYCFGCTLPNAVVNSKEPLRLVINIDGNEITYNIRK